MMIAKYPPTKYWRRLSSVLHGDAQRLQKLKAPWKTKPGEKESEKEYGMYQFLKASHVVKKMKIFGDNRIRQLEGIN